LERDLERLRLEEFEDITQEEKVLFELWNEVVRSNVKMRQTIDNNKMIWLTLEFARLCKLKKIRRLNLFTHCWTLWSTGKLSPEQVL
jgi:hypothetical protein